MGGEKRQCDVEETFWGATLATAGRPGYRLGWVNGGESAAAGPGGQWNSRVFFWKA